jgi:hypothetical protein
VIGRDKSAGDSSDALEIAASLVAGVRDDQLTAPTPCTDASVGDISRTSTASRHRSPPRATNKPLPALSNEMRPSPAQVDSHATPPPVCEAAVALEYLVVIPNDRSCGSLGGAGRPPGPRPTASSRAAAADTDDLDKQPLVESSRCGSILRNGC